jgi:hypothetical protein
MPTPWFFDRLGIAPTRDSKQIKRAYALALKAIDQQAERESFETLRKAYEAALAWLSAGGDDEAFAPAAPAVSVLRTDSPMGGTGAPGAARDDVEPRDVAQDAAPPAADLPPPVAAPGVGGPDAAPVPLPPSNPPSAGSPPSTGPDAGAPAASDAAPRPAPTIISNESYGTGRLAMRQWMTRLLSPQGAPLAQVLDGALADPRLTHLDSRVQLEAQIIEALYRESPGRAELFQLAAARFGWGERNARPAGNPHQAEWIYRVINQQLLWESLDPATRAAQQAALEVARAGEPDKRQQVFDHAPALRDFDEAFPEWAELSLPEGRMEAWQNAFAELPAGWLGAARRRQRLHPYASRIAACVALAIIVGSILFAMIKPMFYDYMRAQATIAEQGRAAVDKPPAAPEAPVLAYEFTGPVTKDSCETAHEFVHESNWLEIDDADAIGLLSTRAMLCQDRKLWPQASDPLMDCLRGERSAALAAKREEIPIICMSKQAASKKRAG